MWKEEEKHRRRVTRGGNKETGKELASWEKTQVTGLMCEAWRENQAGEEHRNTRNMGGKHNAGNKGRITVTHREERTGNN